MRDPYLYDDADVLKNLAGIKDADLLRKAEADITNLAMAGIYNRQYEKFDTETLKDIHRTIFGQIYEWAGEFREIQMIKPEDVLGGDTVRYAYPKEIKKQLAASMKEIAKLHRNGENDREIVFRMVRIIAQIWQTHPFREGNTRSVIVFAILFAKSLGFEVEHEMFRVHASYVRNALVWASQGIPSMSIWNGYFMMPFSEKKPNRKPPELLPTGNMRKSGTTRCPITKNGRISIWTKSSPKTGAAG